MYLSDIHTHSIASGHGTDCTITDMAKAASRKGLKLLGITDHGPATLAAGTPSYFRSLTYAPRKRFGIQLLYGIELNLLDIEGTVDLEQSLLEQLDYAIVSMHTPNFPPRTCEENTQAFLNAMKNPVVKVLGHIDNPHYPLDYETLIKAAGQNGQIIEVNEASLAPYGYRGDTRGCCSQILSLCKKHLVPIILSSDSHGAAHVGDFTYSSAFVHEAMFPESLILNNQIPKLKMLLSAR